MEPSVLVKLFKTEEGSVRMAELVSRIDERDDWSAYTSKLSFLEVARALKKDRKPSELIELNLRELRSHKIIFNDIDDKVMAEAERLVTMYEVYTSDALHAATFGVLKPKLDGFLTDDRHFKRMKDIVNVLRIEDIQ